MKIPKIYIYLSLSVGVLMAIASFMGIMEPRTYSKETLNWASQAMAQDYINLFIAFPVLILTSVYINRALKALLVWLGIMIYLIYSYLVYSFSLHFGELFLVYVSILGLSFYTLIGVISYLPRASLLEIFSSIKKIKSVSFLLASIAIIFNFLWLSDIIDALLNKALPRGVVDIGLVVNPIHVIDLALLLPGSLITALLLYKRSFWGYVFAVPLMTFFIVMGLAIISIMIVLSTKGYPMEITPLVMMSLIIILSGLYSYGILRQVKSIDKI